MKYFSKLLSMLLVGAMLFTVGCTDYDEDIKHLEEKVDDIVETLYNDEINPLKADLADTKANLEQLKQDLEDALAALETKHDEDIEALKTLLESKIAEANQKILNLEGALADEVAAREAAITALTNQLNEAKTELQGKIDAEAAARANGDQALAANLAQEIKDRQDAISALETKLQGEIDTLESSMNGNIQDLREEMNEAIEGAHEAIEEAVATLKSELNTKIDGEIAARQQAIATLESQIADAQSDLQGKIDAEATARANGDQELAEKIAKEIQDRQAAISALETKLAEEVKKLEEAYKAADAELQKQIDDTNLALAVEKTERENADNELKEAIAAEAEARAKGDQELAAMYAKLAKDLEDEIAARKAAIEALEGELAALKNINDAQHAMYEYEISALKAGLERAEKEANAKFEALERSIAALKAELEKQIADNKAAINGNTSAINNLNGQVANLNNVVKNLQDTATQTLSMLMNHIGEFTSFKASVNGQLAALQAKDDQLEAAIEKINEQIDALTVQIETNAALIDQNILDIAANSASIEELKAAAAETYRILSEADQALWNAINTLSATTNAEFAAVRAEAIQAQAELRNEMVAGFAAIQNRIDGVEKAYKANDVALFEEITRVHEELVDLLNKETAAREAADKAMSEAFNSFKANAEMRLAELEKATAELRSDLDALQQNFLKFKDEIQIIIAESITKAINLAVQKSNEYTNTKIDELYTQITGETADKIKALKDTLEGQIADLEDKHDKAVSELTTKIETAVDSLQKQIDTILNRIQSVVFVPEYSDGKGTINWALAGDAIVESRSKMTYAVYPADCAIALAKAWEMKPEDKPAVLTFDVKPLKDPATRASNCVFNIVNVEAHEDGSIDVTFDARNLSAEFYYSRDFAGDFYPRPSSENKDMVMEYAASLVIKTDNENLSSCFTNVVPATPEQITMDVIAHGTNAKVTNKIEPTLEIVYDDMTDSKTILENHYVQFTVDGKTKTTYNGIESLKAAGYDIDLSVNYHARSGREGDGIEPFQYVVNKNNNMEVSLAEVNEDYLYVKNNELNYVDFWYTYTAAGLEVYAGSKVITIPTKATARLADAKFRWEYDLDAIVDEDIYKNGDAATLVYNRTEMLDIVDVKKLPEDTTVARAITEGVLTKVLVNGSEWTEESDLFVDLSIANPEDTNPTLTISNFDWSVGTYKLEFTYTLDNVVLTIAVDVKLDPYKEPTIVIAKETEKVLYKNIKFEPFTEMVESMDLKEVHTHIAAMNFLNSYTDADQYDRFLEEVLGATETSKGYESTVTVVATDGVNEVTKVAAPSWATNMVISENGAFASVGFSYKSFDFVPTKVTYTMDVTLWYGQKAQFIYTVNFVRPTIYNFQHNDLWVFTDNGYYSKAMGRYTTNAAGTDVDKNSVEVRAFAIDNINMDKVFNIIETIDGLPSVILSDENDFAEYVERGLVTEFDFVVEPKDANITIVDNILNYNGRDAFVEVYGKLFLQHDNGARIQLATSFDEGKAYCDYIVKKFDPLTDLKADKEYVYIPVTEVKEIYVDVLKNFSIYESRNGDNKPYELYNADGEAFVVDLITAAGKWFVGSGTNGWYYGKTVNSLDMYGVEFESAYSDVDPAIPAQYKNYIKWDAVNGKLTFDNTYNLTLAVPVEIPVSLTVDYKWAPEGGKKATTKYVFFNPQVNPELLEKLEK